MARASIFLLVVAAVVVVAGVSVAALATKEKVPVHLRRPVVGASADQWIGRRIYQVLTDRFSPSTPSTTASCTMSEYCGGTFQGLTNHLDYIQGMGFDAIWISPVPVNYHLGYHGYWATDFFKINPHFGSPKDLKAFVDAAHARNIWIMMDIVVNHVGPVGNDFSSVYPFNQSSHYHRNCAINQYICFTTEIFECRLADLPDLNQTVPYVNEQLTKYVKWLMTDFGFDGIRADTVMYIEQAYWNQLLASIGNIFVVGEVWSSFSCEKAYTQYGVDSTLNYDLFTTLRGVFQDGNSMRTLGDTWRQQQSMWHPDWQVNFVDNHDNDRFLNATNNIPAYKSALAHMFFTNGIPCVYYGTEQYFSGGISDNYCRQPLWPTNFQKTDMYNFLATMNKAYTDLQVWKNPVEERWQDDTLYCFIRGPMMLCTTKTNQQQTRTIPNLPFAGMNVCQYFDPSAPCMTGYSTMQITVPAGGLPVLFYGKSD